jgi:hypothetical protein
MSTATENSSRLVQDLTVDNLTQHVINICTKTAPDARSKELLSGLIQHVHDYIREVQMKPGEWEIGWKYLTEVSKFKIEHPMASRRVSGNLDSNNLGRSILHC